MPSALTPHVHADTIARAVTTRFSQLPAKCRPRARPNGIREWTPLAGIVLEHPDGRLDCVALATGMKATPSAALPAAAGCVLHDSHAEILAIRAFNLFLLTHRHAPYLLPDSRFNPALRIHLYTSSAPCGDASMTATIAAQPDATPWEARELIAPGVLRGRANFDVRGAVRTKPGRADSRATLSKSCSDKLAVRQCLGLLLAPAASVVAGAVYLDSVVLPVEELDRAGCERAWGARGRLAGLVGREWAGGYKFRPFEVRATGVRCGLEKTEGAVGASVCAVWCEGVGAEALINGVLQGRRVGEGLRGASMVSRVRLAQRVGWRGRYGAAKAGMGERERVKADVRECLGGWVASGEDDFEVPEDA